MVTEPQERIGIYLCDRIKRANGPTAEALLENSLAVAEVGARSGAALPRGLRTRPPPAPVTSVFGRNGDIFIGWTHLI
jgi:hypothetical protein